MNLIKSSSYILLILSQFYFNSAFGVNSKFSYAKLNNCAPTIVEFTNNSTTGAGIVYTWDFGLGAVVNTSSNAKLQQLYSKPGKYRISLLVTDGVNTDSSNLIITISQGPKASFISNVTAGCKPLDVTFTSTSSQGDSAIVNTYWDFRNGDTQSGAIVNFNYPDIGKYNIVLKVTDKNNCFSLIESDSLIKVFSKPKAVFTATDTFSCNPPLNVTYFNQSYGYGNLTYNWNFGNNETSTDINSATTYNANGSYNVILKVTDPFGCTDSTTKKSYINIGIPKASLLVYDANNYPVTKTLLCSGTYKFECSLHYLPEYIWILKDNNKETTVTGQSSITYQVKDTGKLEVNLIYGKNEFCTEAIQKTFTKSHIKANFFLDSIQHCNLPLQVFLNNISDSASKCSWYFSKKFISNLNNTTYSILQNDLPPRTYKQIYSHELESIYLPISLAVSNNDGCYDSITKKIAFTFPIARFMPDKISGCIPLTVSFSDSSHASGTIDKFIYKIGSDSVVTAAKNPVAYTFNKPGEFYVSEIIKSGNCYDTSYVVKIIAGEKLVPDISVSPSEICNGEKIRITGKSNNNNLVDQWYIKSIGLFYLNTPVPPDTSLTILADNIGDKDISLVLESNGCFSDTTIKAIFRIKGLSGNFIDTFSCTSPLNYEFRTQIGPAKTLIWKIDTATINNEDTVKYKFPSSGDFSVKITAFDNALCSLSISKIISVRQIKASFTLKDSSICSGDTSILNASNSVDYINNCYKEGFLWDFADGSPPRRTVSGINQHVYTQKGSYTIKLKTLADNGCIDSTIRIIKVNKPNAEYTVDKYSGCVPSLTVNFKNKSNDSTIMYAIWEYGDGTRDSSALKDVIHKYSSANQNSYYPTLNVYDAYGCTNTYTVPINLFEVNADFQADDNAICAGRKVTFFAINNNLQNLSWNFGEGAVSSNNYHTYNNKGLFNVSLVASRYGCTDTVTKINYISVEKADGNFTVSDSILNCYPDTLYFNHPNLTGSPVTDRTWTFGNTELNNKNDVVSYIYTHTGNYKVKLDVKTLNGCSATKTRTIVINGPSALFNFSPKSICYNQVVNFTLDSIKNTNYWEWLFRDGTTSTANPAKHQYTSRGEITPVLVLKNNDCTVTLALDTLKISRVQAGFNTISDSILCYGENLSFHNTSVYSNSWNWVINNAIVSDNFDLNEVVLPRTGINDVSLIALDSENCTDTATTKINIYANPSINITGDSLLCRGKDSIALSVNKENGWSIKWTPESSMSNSKAFNNSVWPSNTTVYTATVTDLMGCFTAREKTIYVKQPFVYTRVPAGDTTINIGQTLQLLIYTNNNDLAYSWSPLNKISCIDCSNPLVNPTNDVTYTVQIKDICIQKEESFNISVIRDFYLEAPTAFTPNDDLNNDIFKFESKNIKNVDLKIFNRWGKIVFETSDIAKGWDGKVNGKLQNVDTYTYYIKAETIYDYTFEKKGSFLLLK